ncbi:MAG: DNA repair exonuclease [Lachnospiraceae bacterium]|nr:DNA repair exonuclease [Lachnospiraceae bacterium]
MRFMHMADVHLGAVPDSGAPWSGAREKEIWDTFRSSIQDAASEQLDLLLIAGDLFHRQPLLAELKEVNYLFSTLPKTRVVLIAGNHDYLQPASCYLNFPWNRNVACLFSRQCERVRFPEINTEVYGLSYYRQEIQEPLYDELRPVRDDYCHILLAHGGDSQHIPMSRELLAKSGFDYLALGHIHKPQMVAANKAAYAGALGPIDCNDTGPHGYILGEYKKGKMSVSFVPKAKREYVPITIEAEEQDTTFSLRDKLEKQIEQRGWQHIYRVTLKGFREPGIQYDTDKMKDFGMVLDVSDQTVPAFHLDELKRKYHGQLIGRYIESFEGHDRSAVEELALQYGLEALLGS